MSDARRQGRGPADRRPPVARHPRPRSRPWPRLHPCPAASRRGSGGILGYDDREIAQFLRPGLTTLLLPHHEMGFQAAAALIDGQLRPSGRQPQIKLECPVVERASVGPPRAR